MLYCNSHQIALIVKVRQPIYILLQLLFSYTLTLTWQFWFTMDVFCISSNTSNKFKHYQHFVNFLILTNRVLCGLMIFYFFFSFFRFLFSELLAQKVDFPNRLRTFNNWADWFISRNLFFKIKIPTKGTKVTHHLIVIVFIWTYLNCRCKRAVAAFLKTFF